MQWRRDLTRNPSDLGWRIAALFMTGSFIFALGSFPPYSQNVDPGTVGITFVAGSIIFTVAGYSTVVQVINDGDHADDSGRRHYWAWQPRRMLWWASVVQLAGTLFFNASTIDAMIAGLAAKQANILVWAPDFFGSISFLVASHLGWLIVCHRLWCVRREDAEWWVAAINYTGSIFFMLSAIASFTLKTTGEELNTTIVNSGTFIGAICFFVGAYLLLPPAKAPSNIPTGGAAP